MSEHLFRAWNPIKKEYLDWAKEEGFALNGEFVMNQGFFNDSYKLSLEEIVSLEFEECLNVPDKRGKMMFEGDIVEFSYCNNVHKAEIVYNIKTCGFEVRYVTVVGEYGERAVHSLNFANIENIKGIGNKHSNPELLGGKS